MIMKNLSLGLLASILLCQTAFAAEQATSSMTEKPAKSAAQFSTVNFNYPNADKVEGFRFSTLHGKTANMKGLDLTLLGMSETDNFSGVSFSLFAGINKVNKHFSGVSLSAANWHLGQDEGLNIGLVNVTNSVKGVNFGIVNLSNTVAGANIGFINYNKKFSLVDFGVMNIAKTAKFQFGIFNVAENLQGLQIGLLNYAENGVVKILPLVNFRKTF